MNDLIVVCDNLANKADSEGNQDAEITLSRILAELKAEFHDDLDDDYLKLAQLFDPRVCHCTESQAEVDRILSHAINTYIPDSTPNGEVNNDIFAEPHKTDFAHEVSVFKAHLRQVKKVVVTKINFGEVQNDSKILIFFRFINQSSHRFPTL